jgi:enoyl-CoA hydratase/carnithine racemase
MSSIRVESHEGLLDRTIDSPATGNLITEEMSLAIERALSGAGADIKLVRLASTGENFCRGRKSPPIDRATATALAFRQTIAEGPLRLYRAFQTCRAPVYRPHPGTGVRRRLCAGRLM